MTFDGGTLEVVRGAAFAGLMGLAAGWDLKEQRIPNLLNLAGLLLGLALRVPLGLGAVGDGLLGAGLALLIGLPFFALGAMGGGDIKLLVVVGAFLAPARLLDALLVIGALGGVVAVVNAVRKGVILPVLLDSYNVMKRWLTLGAAGYGRSLDSPGAVAIPYGVPIAIGALVVWFLGVPWR